MYVDFEHTFVIDYVGTIYFKMTNYWPINWSGWYIGLHLYICTESDVKMSLVYGEEATSIV